MGGRMHMVLDTVQEFSVFPEFFKKFIEEEELKVNVMGKILK